MKIFSTILVLLFISNFSFAQPGSLDTSFAEGGILVADLSDTGFDTGNDVVVQPDGKLLVCSSSHNIEGSKFDIAVTRINTDGTIDSTFALNGTFHYGNPDESDLGYHVSLLDDGSIILAGSYADEPANPQWALIKLDAEGALVPDFGVNGIVLQDIDSSEDYARSVAVTESGQLIVGGFSRIPNNNGRRNVVARYNADGALDATFGTDGIFMWNTDSTVNETYTVQLLDDGSILAGGYSKPSSADRPAIYKVLPDGSGLDTSFGIDGGTLAPVEGKGYGMQIHPNGNILICSPTSGPMGNDLAVTAFNPDGSINEDFGIEGVFFVDNDALDVGLDLAVQTDGKIVICGETGGGFFGNPRRFFTARCDADGVLDTTWGDMGVTVTNTFDPFFAFANAIAIQPADGKVVIVGASAFPGATGNDLTVVRFNNFVDADMDGFALGDGDCDDSNAAVNPDADEIPYNGIDDDCDATTPDDDLDGDGFLLADDCDDNNADVNPDNMEIAYNGIDDDCDATTPDDDLDGDGFLLADDCDDMNMDINPDAEDIPNNGIDEDCDGFDTMTSVNETALSRQFNIYPNPATDLVYIDFDASTVQPQRVDILDYTGKVVKSITDNFNNNQLAVAVADLHNGMLVFLIHTSEGVAVKRVVKD